jgi:hypothetical protein
MSNRILAVSTWEVSVHFCRFRLMYSSTFRLGRLLSVDRAVPPSVPMRHSKKLVSNIEVA